MKTITIIGGGFSGSIFALKLAAAHPETRVILLESGTTFGPGLAYGKSRPWHLLNVPVNRMEPGLSPGFSQWLANRPAGPAPADANDTGAEAFVPRSLYGDYLQSLLAAAVANGKAVVPLRGEAVDVLGGPKPAVQLSDGRLVNADRVVLATGNLAPRGLPDEIDGVYSDPWSSDPCADLAAEDPVLLIGTGMTMVDMAASLGAQGHRGSIIAVSRRGLMPRPHRGSGAWPAFLDATVPWTPTTMLRRVREEIDRAAAENVPWQRVIDAVRPALPTIWDGWRDAERGSFLRHARPYWDVHRHRTPPAVEARLDRLRATGQLRSMAGRIVACRPCAAGVTVTLAPRRSHAAVTLTVARVINCSGPRSDFADIEIPLYAALRARGLIVADPHGLGIETRDCAVIDRRGNPSSWLYALGPLTRPAEWEVTAVPEICAQIDRLVSSLLQARNH